MTAHPVGVWCRRTECIGVGSKQRFLTSLEHLLMENGKPSPTPPDLEPKILGWILILTPKLRDDTRLNGHGVLLDHECRVLGSLLVKHIVAHLQSFGFGYGLAERFPSYQETERLTARTDSLREYDEAKLRRDRLMQSRERMELVNAIVERLRNETDRALRVTEDQSLENVMVRLPMAASYFIQRLWTAWNALSPAQKFVLLGGEAALKATLGERIGKAAAYTAVADICLRGTLKHRDSRAGVEKKDLTIDKDHLRRARLFAAKIPSSWDVWLDTWSRKPSVTPVSLPALIAGLQHKVSRRGRFSRTATRVDKLERGKA